MKFCRSFTLPVIAIFCFAVSGRAQTSSGTISGHIVDQTDAVVPSAEVKLINQQTAVMVSTQVRSNGDFIFSNVQPGTFTVIVQASGYKELRKVNLQLSASQVLSAGTFTLQIGEVSQSVTVSAEITPIQNGSSERSGVLDSKQIDNLLAVGRDAMSFVRVLPGVVGSGGSSSLGTSNTPTINGVNSEYNSATIDGVTGNTRGLSTLDTPVNLDAVQEVTVMASNYQAQYGKTAGANINFVTKSGTQQFHGGLYYYFRNEALNANAYFTKYNGSLVRPRYRFNTYGGTIGGPIYWPGHFNTAKNKLFFFVSLENSPITSPDGLKTYKVPTVLEVNGDYSQSYNQGNAIQDPAHLIRVKDPTSSSACAVNSATPGAGCFPGNVIPASRINTQAQALLKVLYNNTLGLNPGFAINNLSTTNNNYNYATNYSGDKPVNQEIFRIDYFPTEKLHMFGRVNLESVNNNSYSSPANSLPWLMKVNYKTSNPNFAFNVIYTFSPTLVNELNLGTAGWNESQLYDPADLAKVQLSSTGYNIPALYPGVNPLNLFPSVSFGLTNSANFGWDSRFPMGNKVRSYSATDNMTKIIASHTLKFGVDAQTDSYLQVNHNRVGNFSYARDANNPNDSNYAYSNAMLGNFDTMTEVTALVNYKPRTNTLEWYAQDQWKLNNKLTLDYGMRFSWAMAQRLSAGNNFAPELYKASSAPFLYQPTTKDPKTNLPRAIDPTTGAFVPGAWGGLFVPNTGNLQNGILNVNTPGYPQGTLYGNGIIYAPRIGFAYDPFGQGKTVIRGGYGIFYNVRARSGQSGDMTNNAPTTNSPTQYYGNLNTFQNAGSLSGPYTIGHAIPLHAPVVSTMNTSLGIQQMVGAGVVLDVAYVGTFGRHLSNYTPINTVPYNSQFLWSSQSPAGGVLPDNFFRPYPGFGTINMQYFNLTSSYNSLQVRATKRFSKGLEFGAAYTWSKSMDYGSCQTASAQSTSSCSEAYNVTVANYQNLRTWNYGPASFDIRNNVVANYLWSLPKGSSVWSNVLTRAVLDNWQISGIASYLSGTPGGIILKTSNGANITGGGDGARVNLSGNPMQGAPRTFNQWFNTGVVSAPVAGVAATSATSGYKPGDPGNAPKVNYYLPGYTNFDTALFKNIPIEGKLTVQFRLETYNTFNHTQFNSLNNTATFATAASTTNPNPAQTDATFGRFNGANNPRYLQLALRLNF